MRVLAYDEDACELKTEIMDYHANQEIPTSKQQSLQFLLIDKISFKSIDTGQLLRSVELKRMPVNTLNVSEPTIH